MFNYTIVISIIETDDYNSYIPLLSFIYVQHMLIILMNNLGCVASTLHLKCLSRRRAEGLCLSVTPKLSSARARGHSGGHALRILISFGQLYLL